MKLLFHPATVTLGCILLVSSTAASTAGRTAIDPWDIYHPLDEGLWVDASRRTSRLSSLQSRNNRKNECKHQGRENNNNSKFDELLEEDIMVDAKFKGLRNDLRMAEIDSLRLFSRTPLPVHAMQPMKYVIFSKGQSALRTVDEKDRHLIQPETLFGLTSHKNDNDNNSNNKSEGNVLHAHHYRVCAALLLLRGYSDAAHEVLLGVSLNNLEEAEYAASHRGKTDWAEKHPLSTAADILHAAIHRIVEGNELGEGDQTGYDNARYWLAGGPKVLDAPASHPVREALVRIAREHTPKCFKYTGIVAGDNVEHRVLSGGGKTRMVRVPCGQWDDFKFLELCQKWADGTLEKDLEDEVATLQRAEVILILRHELMECLRRSTDGAK